jgi:hypothetical protein
LERALRVVLRRELHDFVIGEFGPGHRRKRCRLGAVLGPHPIERGGNQAAEQITGFLCLRSVLGHDAVEYDEIGGYLRQFVALGVVGILGKGNQQAKDKGRHYRDQSHHQIHDIL